MSESSVTSNGEISEEHGRLCDLGTTTSHEFSDGGRKTLPSQPERDTFVRANSLKLLEDPTTLEIQRLPPKKLSRSVSARFTKAGKAMHISKDRKKKRVDESHKHFLTAHCIRDGIRYTTTNTKDATETTTTTMMMMAAHAETTAIGANDVRVVRRTTLPITTTPQVESCETTSGTSSFSTFSFLGGKNLDAKSFEFKEYAPQVFLKLRNHWGIHQADYLRSLASEELYLDFQSNSKSGQFFFFSDDKFFMIKTLTPQECGWLQQCLEKYYQHHMKYKKTLLVKFMGLYRIKVPRYNHHNNHNNHSRRQPSFRKKHFVVMRSTFDTVLPMHKKFDLKGSRVGREASESDRKKLFPVLKDLDLEKSGTTLRLGPHKETMLEQLRIDCEWLARLNVMDYSLLVGIFDKTRVDPAYEMDDRTVRDILDQDHCLHFIDRLDDHKLVYFVGVIDFLQHYNANKRMENIAKSIVNDSNEISSVRPNFYAARLVKFISSFVEE